MKALDSNLEKIVMEAKNLAREELAATWNCALAPLRALYRVLNLPLDKSLEAAAIGFAGGISGNGSLCGALWAAVHAVSAYVGLHRSICWECRGSEFIESNMRVHYYVARTFQRFREKLGGTMCGELNPYFDYRSLEGRKRCTRIVEIAVETALETIWEARSNLE